MSFQCRINNADCGELHMAHGLCHFHYGREYRGQDLYEPKKWGKGKGRCIYGGCDRIVYSRLRCRYHYSRRNQPNGGGDSPSMEPCPIPNCTGRMSYKSEACKRHNQMRWRYAVSVEYLMELFLDPKCHNRACASREDLVMDHDHACCPVGKFPGHRKSCGKCNRGLLCRKCNSALGQVDDDIEKIRGLIDYLERSPS